MPRGRPQWLASWLERHQSRVSFWLHAAGIPLVIAALILAAYQLWEWRWDLWWRPALLFAAGYVLQIIGHLYEGNDVGEWILIKRLLGRPYVAISPRFSPAPLPSDAVSANRRPEPSGTAVDRKTVAIVGASNDRSKFGNKAVRAYLRQGWDVYPVNPSGGRVEGLRVYPSLADIPVKLDRVSLYVPPAVGVRLLPAIAQARPAELFINPGAESDELVAQARELGLDPIRACSILDIGQEPADFGA